MPDINAPVIQLDIVYVYTYRYGRKKMRKDKIIINSGKMNEYTQSENKTITTKKKPKM